MTGSTDASRLFRATPRRGPDDAPRSEARPQRSADSSCATARIPRCYASPRSATTSLNQTVCGRVRHARRGALSDEHSRTRSIERGVVDWLSRMPSAISAGDSRTRIISMWWAAAEGFDSDALGMSLGSLRWASSATRERVALGGAGRKHDDGRGCAQTSSGGTPPTWNDTTSSASRNRVVWTH
jgi:hypothetical protein